MSHKTRVLITVAVLVLGIVGVAGTAVATHEDDHVAEIKDIQINGVDEDGDGYYRSFDIEINADTICNGCYDEGWIPGADSDMEPYFTVEINNVGIESTSDVSGDSDLTYTISVPESEVENFQTELDATLEVHLMERDAAVDDHIDGVTRDIRIEHAEDDEANQPPAASLTASPSSPSTSDTVTFDASGSSDPDGSIQSYSWDFGDGSTATGQTASHSYSSSGDYTVELTVTDDSGATDTTTRTVSVTGGNTPPTASFTYSPGNPDADEPVTLDASGSSDPDGTVQRYEWDFGDGNTATATGDTVTHTYSSAGTYTVELTAIDDNDATDTTTQTVSVGDVGTEPISIDAPDTTQPDGEFEFDVTMTDSSVGEIAVESSDFDVELSVVDDDGDSIGTQTDTSVEFIDLDSETSTYTLDVDITGGSVGQMGMITAATGGNIDGSGVNQISSQFSLADVPPSPVEGVSDELWTAVTQGNGELSLGNLGTAITEYQENGEIDGVQIELSDLGSLIQHYQNEVA